MVRPVGWLARALVVAIAVGACTTRDGPGAPGIEWDVRDAPGEVTAVVSAGARVIAAGATAPIGDPSGRPAVWLSDDGRTWESASVEGDGLILALVAGEGQLLAVGRSAAAGAARAVAWTSSDGRDWKRVAPAAFAPRPGCLSTELDGVAAGPGGYVAVGTEWGESSCGQDAAAWLSPDGKTWTRVDMPPGTHLMHTVVGGSGGYVAVGAGKASANEGTRGAFVFSPHGRSWTQADEQGVMAAEPQAVLADPKGYLAIGMTITDLRSGAMAPAAWRSSDGRAWRRLVADGFVWDDATIVPAQPGQQVTKIALTNELVRLPSGLLALGAAMTMSSGPDGAQQQSAPWRYLGWTSDAGDAWTRVQDDPKLVVGAVTWYVLGPSAAVVHEERLLVFGTRWPAPDADGGDIIGRPTIWETDATTVGNR